MYDNNINVSDNDHAGDNDQRQQGSVVPLLNRNQVSKRAIDLYMGIYNSFINAASHVINGNGNSANPSGINLMGIVREVAAAKASLATKEFIAVCGYKAVINDKGDDLIVIYQD